MTPEQEQALVGGGDCPLHFHSADQDPNGDFGRQLARLEIVVSTSVDLDMETSTDERVRSADIIRCNTSAGNVTITLPKCIDDGRRITLVNSVGANAARFKAQVGDTVCGTAPPGVVSQATNGALRVKCYSSTEWDYV